MMMRRRLRGRPTSAFVSVTAGTAVGQLFLVASLPLIARIYEPGDVGRFGVVLAACQVAGIVTTGRIEQILPRVEAVNRWPIVRRIGMLMLVLVPVTAVAEAMVLGRLGLGAWAAIAALVLSLCAFNVCSYVAFAEHEFALIARMRVVNGVVTAGAQVLGGLVLPTANMLIVTYAFGNVVACGMIIVVVRRIRHTSQGVSTRRAASDEHIGRFAVTVGSTSLVSNLSLGLPLFGISFLYGEAAAGSFFLARRMLMLPTQLVASTISDVSYSLVARKDVPHIRRHVVEWLKRLRFLGLLLLVAGFAGGPVAQWLVGPEYEHVVFVVWLMTIPAVAQMVGTSMSNILLALNRELMRMVINVVKLVALLLVFVIAHFLQVPFLVTVAALAAVLTTWYCASLWVTWRILSTDRGVR